jgi:hypothetical protein
MRKSITALCIGLAILLVTALPARAQTEIVQDYSTLLDIPNIKTIEASTSHLYVLSELDGMAVFRVYGDSLQWLYTSAGMQRRGHIIESDIRFAYLYGDSRRLTVLEPTSVLGVYSSTILPVAPLGVARLQNSLFVALGDEGLGMLSLETPETVDSEAEIVANGVIGRAAVIDVASSVISNQLFVLAADQKLHVFSMGEDGLESTSSLDLSTSVSQLFLDEEQVWAASSSGEIYEVNSNGLGRQIGKVNEPVETFASWNNNLLVRTQSGKIYRSFNGGRFSLWKSETSAGNFLTKSKDALWFAAFNKLSALLEIQPETNTQAQSTGTGSFSIAQIPNQVLTYPNPLILGLELENDYPAEEVEFTYRSTASNANIKKQGFFWRPTINQVGYNSFSIIATNAQGQIDSTDFVVEVRTFNSPPRFSPVRGSTLVVDDPYELQFNAVDPENPSSTLIRYLGVDLPEGSTLDERTGRFKWTPTERQVGERTFRVVATDAQGTASSIEVTYTVIDLEQGED